MTAGVFVLTDAHSLVPMRAEGFVSEDDFQTLLERFPELLVGDQIDRQVPRRFVLVEREQAIADEEGASGRWSLDHLFLDQDGIPTLVEVKRSTDTRIRREVVGQMLDYAANAVLHWPVQDLRARFETRCLESGLDPAIVLSTSLGWQDEADPFWERVQVNLQAGKIRLLFVADIIPRELRRIVEFLNVQMQPAEVLAIELRQYQGAGLRTLVPMVIGQTQAALQGKSSSAALPKRQWDEAAILARLAETLDEAGMANARRLIDWMKRRATRVVFNTNPSWGSIGAGFSRDGIDMVPLVLWTDGKLCVQFQFMIGKPVVGEPAFREELHQRLNAAPGIDFPPDAVSRRPTVPIGALTSAAADQFLAVIDWLAEKWRGG